MAAISGTMIMILTVGIAATTGSVAQGAGGAVVEKKDWSPMANQYQSANYVLTSGGLKTRSDSQGRREAMKALGIGGKTSSGNNHCSDPFKGRGGDVVGNGRSGHVVGNGRCNVDDIYRHRRNRMR